MDLPKGIYFEKQRNRYRVRLYKYRHVVWRSYHNTLHEALNAWAKAVSAQAIYEIPNLHYAPPQSRAGAAFAVLSALQ